MRRLSLKWLTKGLQRLDALRSGKAEEATKPPPEWDETELECLRRELYELRIKFTGLNKKLRSLHSRISTLKVRWPRIYDQVFSSQRHTKRK